MRTLHTSAGTGICASRAKMSEHLAFMKSIVALDYKEVEVMRKNQRKLGLIEKGRSITRIENEEVIIEGQRIHAHRVFVKTADSGEYKHVGWVMDRGINNCMMCAKVFGIMAYRHHCRSCGNIVCSACSPYWHEIMELKGLGPQRLCLCCYWFQEEVYVVSSPVNLSSGAEGDKEPSGSVLTPSLQSKLNDMEAMETFTPSAVFVLKSSTGSSKVFINIMHHTKIPLREGTQENESGKYDPIILSRGPRNSLDKKKNTCIVFDAVVNSKVIRELSRTKTEIFCEAIFRHLESKYSTIVDKSIVIPSIAGNYKDGPIIPMTLTALMVVDNAVPFADEMGALRSKSNGVGENSLVNIFPNVENEFASAQPLSYKKRMSAIRCVLRFMPYLVLKTRRGDTGGKVFINILGGWIEEEEGSSDGTKSGGYADSTMFKFSSESPGFILASKLDPKASSHSMVQNSESDYAVYDVILCENFFKCIRSNKDTFSDYVFKTIILYIVKTYDLPDLNCTTYSFPKFKFRQYKSREPFDEENNKVFVSEEQCDFMNFLTVATVSEAELTHYLTSMVPA